MRRTYPLLAIVICLGAALAVGCTDNKKLSINKEISPRRGPYLGGDPVTITGTGFSTTQDIKIYFGDKAAKTPLIKEGGEIVVEPPAGDVGKTVDVVIVFQDLSKSVTLRNAYTYIDPTDIEKKPGTEGAKPEEKKPEAPKPEAKPAESGPAASAPAASAPAASAPAASGPASAPAASKP